MGTVFLGICWRFRRKRRNFQSDRNFLTDCSLFGLALKSVFADDQFKVFAV